MPATIANSAAPPWAVKVWADDNNIYAEVPSHNGPCVIAYARSEGGLSKILTTLGALHTVEGHGEQYLRPHLLTKQMISDGITNPDLESARKALLELGLIK